jgi:hypothetical protein
MIVGRRFCSLASASSVSTASNLRRLQGHIAVVTRKYALLQRGGSGRAFGPTIRASLTWSKDAFQRAVDAERTICRIVLALYIRLSAQLS